MSYRAVIFDLFGTLVPFFNPEPYRESLLAMADALGLDHEAFLQQWAYDTLAARMGGELATVEAGLAEIARALGASPTPEQIARATRLRLDYYRTTLRPWPDAVPTLRALKALGLRLGLISDCSCEAPLLWAETPLAALIDGPVFSCSEGLRKPDRRLYDLACRRLGVAPAECIYVGDGFGGELGGARAAGMEAVLITPPGEVGIAGAESEAATWTGPRVRTLGELLQVVREYVNIR